MFLQDGVIPGDRPPLRCLWREHQAAQDAVFECVGHIFDSKYSPTFANDVLKRTATDNQANFPNATGSVHNNFFQDDYLESSSTANEASNKAKDLINELEMSFFEIELTKIVSNVPSTPIEVDPNSDTRTTEEKEILTAEKFSQDFGLKWNHSTDTLVVGTGTSPNRPKYYPKGCSEFGIRCIRPNWTRRIVHRQSMSAFENHLEA